MMNDLRYALDSLTKDTALIQFDELRIQLELTTKKEELVILAGNHEIMEVIKGFKLTKKIRHSINKNTDVKKWIDSTTERYSRYLEFLDDSKDDHPEICRNVSLINKLFIDKTISFKNMTKIVYKTDKSLIKLFKKWDLVE